MASQLCRFAPRLPVGRQILICRSFCAATKDIGNPLEQGDVDGDGSVSSTGPKGSRIYRRTRAEHDRVFRWGVGNHFRSQCANRFTPTHAQHPMEITVRDDYYESDNTDIMWDELNEGWEVFWYENNKLNAKPFPVKKYGLERAKVEAFTYHAQLKEQGRLQQRPRDEVPEAGVFFDRRLQAWYASFWLDGRPQTRGYSATKYGYEGAKLLAISKRRDPVNGVLAVRPGAGNPPREKPMHRLLKPFFE
mmetsp:Transcript_99/g.275  ORF Transcript_99/g.275 Transcript_99/m.275 type:complete len:248 (-) Transcript_99:54-797(-)